MDRILAALDPLAIAVLLGSFLLLWALGKVIFDDDDLSPKADDGSPTPSSADGEQDGPAAPKSGSRSGRKKAA